MFRTHTETYPFNRDYGTTGSRYGAYIKYIIFSSDYTHRERMETVSCSFTEFRTCDLFPFDRLMHTQHVLRSGLIWSSPLSTID